MRAVGQPPGSLHAPPQFAEFRQKLHHALLLRRGRKIDLRGGIPGDPTDNPSLHRKSEIADLLCGKAEFRKRCGLAGSCNTLLRNTYLEEHWIVV
jgi:hypothetical protein